MTRARDMTDWTFAEEMRRRLRENPRDRRCEECGRRIGRWRKHSYCDEHEALAAAERRGGPRKRKEVFRLPSLRRYRESERISRELLAETAGVSVTTIKAVECGERGVGKTTALKVVYGLRELLGMPGLSLHHLEAGRPSEERRSA